MWFGPVKFHCFRLPGVQEGTPYSLQCSLEGSRGNEFLDTALEGEVYFFELAFEGRLRFPVPVFTRLNSCGQSGNMEDHVWKYVVVGSPSQKVNNSC